MPHTPGQAAGQLRRLFRQLASQVRLYSDDEELQHKVLDQRRG